MTLKPIRLLPDGDADHPWKPSSLTEPENFTTKDRTERIREYYSNADESVLAGVWECAPCLEEIDAYPVNEMMVVISGSLTLTNADGSSETFGPGDTFFIAKGTKCTWHITKSLRKFYMIAE